MLQSVASQGVGQDLVTEQEQWWLELGGWQWGWREGEGQKDPQVVGMSEVWKVMRMKEWTVLSGEKQQPQTHTWIHLWERKIQVLIKNPKGYQAWARSILDVRKIPNNKGFTASCTMLWTSVHSFSGTLPTRSNPLKLCINSMHIPLLLYKFYGVGTASQAFSVSLSPLVGSSHFRVCDIMTYNKKYIFGLCPPFWHRVPKTLTVS